MLPFDLCQLLDVRAVCFCELQFGKELCAMLIQHPVTGGTCLMTDGRGEEAFPVESVSGNYAAFYSLVKAAIENGSAAPVSLADALRVAEIIEEARAISVR